ncbi:coronin-1B-like isoform X2 [Lineus longissimus]|uniref:coronin-1B-like isoform X2 n=1 Tax=Lineus longissimus TaxID=88925 RepID=UPI002B4EAB5B
MSYRLNRPKSHYNHMYGKPANQAECYSDIRISRTPFDGLFCCVNLKYLAIITEAGGGAAFMILPLSQTGRVKTDQPTVDGHKGKVLDIKWNPFDDNLIASCSEDTSAKVWQVEEKKDGVYAKLCVDLVHHQKKVTHIEWHPTAKNVLLTAGADKMIYIWDLMKPEIMFQFEFPDCDSFLSFNFNYNGSQLVVSTKETGGKDGFIHVLDVRKGEILAKWSAHPRNAMALFVKDGRVFTTGSKKMTDRKCAIWDLKDTSAPLESCEVDNFNRALFPFYDCDTNLVYLWGKGESAVKFYEIFDKPPYIYYLGSITSANSGKGIAFMPKRGLDMTINEMARIYKLVDKSSGGMCEVISCLVSRIDKTFQDDLYPDTLGPNAVLTADDWRGGADAVPELVSLRERFDELSVEDTQAEGTSTLGSSSLGTSSLGSSSLGSSSLGNKSTVTSNAAKKPETRKFSAPVSTSSGATVATRVKMNSNRETNTTPPPEPVSRATPPPRVTSSPAPDSDEVTALRGELVKTQNELKDTKDEVTELKKRMKKLDTRLKMMEAKVTVIEQQNHDDDEAEV